MLTALLRRMWEALKPQPANALEPVRPIVVTDAERAAELERRRAAIDFKPAQGFIHERFHERPN